MSRLRKWLAARTASNSSPILTPAKTGAFLDQRDNRRPDRCRRMRACSTRTMGRIRTGRAQEGEAGGGDRHLDSCARDAAPKPGPQWLRRADEIHSRAMEFMAKRDEKFDLIVLDPPRWRAAAPMRNDGRMYADLNAFAMRRFGGCITFSCSRILGRRLHARGPNRAGQRGGTCELSAIWERVRTIHGSSATSKGSISLGCSWPISNSR